MTAQRSSEKLANLVWELTEDSEESAQTGEVTMTLTKAQAQELYGLFWRLGGKYQRGLYECGWKPSKEGQEVMNDKTLAGSSKDHDTPTDLKTGVVQAISLLNLARSNLNPCKLQEVSIVKRQLAEVARDLTALLSTEFETREQPMLTVRSRGPIGPNDVIVDATELVKHVTFRMSLKTPANANAQKANAVLDRNRDERFVGHELVRDPNLIYCEDCPPIGYPTDKTRCAQCPRRSENGNPQA